MHMRLLVPTVTITAIAAALFVVGGTYIHYERLHETMPILASVPTLEEPYERLTMQFVGDIMLGRDVELKMREYGASYPYTHMLEHLTASYVVGNFEASIPFVHVPTPSMTMRFSVDPEFIPALSAAGFTHLSLANNHGYDYGAEGYWNARAVLSANETVPFGHPYELAESSVAYIEHAGMRVALIGVYAVVSLPSEEELESLFSSAESSDLQIAYVHWGDEYELVHNAAQETLAHRLIDAGADLVVGHHPHVVQDIGSYQGVPIVYSLGNFVFDQYFSTDVQQGLMLTLTEENFGRYVLALTPLTSEYSRVVPQVMVGTEREAFLETLAMRSSRELRDQVRSGTLMFGPSDLRLRTADNSI